MAMSKVWVRSTKPGAECNPKKIVRAIYDLAGGEPMIDLGCGECLQTEGLKGVFMDINPRPGSPVGTVVADIRDAPLAFHDKHFNLCILIDVIEHLYKEDGQKLLAEMYTLCSAILLFTPTGELFIKADDGPHCHRSGWYPQEFWKMGYVIWEWPIFHSWEPDTYHGAFWAWKFKDRKTPDVDTVAESAGVKP